MAEEDADVVTGEACVPGGEDGTLPCAAGLPCAWPPIDCLAVDGIATDSTRHSVTPDMAAVASPPPLNDVPGRNE